jgi:predicted Zn-dependent peptidase
MRATLLNFGTVPKANVTVVVRAGALNEWPTTGIADLASQLLAQGTSGLDRKDILDSASLMGGEISINVTADETSISLEILSEYSCDAIALLAEILIRPSFLDGEFVRVRNGYELHIDVKAANPQVMARVAFADALYPDHAYGRVHPAKGELDSYSIEAIRDYYSVNFGARRAHIYVVGKFDEALADKAIHKHFGQWHEGPEPLKRVPSTPARLGLKLIDRPCAAQSTIRLGQRVVSPSHPEFISLSVANALLGETAISRMSMNLRETKGWAYSLGSGLLTFYRQCYWVAVASVNSAVTGEVVSEILREVEFLGGSVPHNDELNAIKNYRYGVFLTASCSRAGILRQLVHNDLQEASRDWFETFVEKIYAVTPEQVTQAVKQYLAPTEMTVVVVGDKSIVWEQLKAVSQLRGRRID